MASPKLMTEGMNLTLGGPCPATGKTAPQLREVMARGGSCPAAAMSCPQTLARRGPCPATTGLFMRPVAELAIFSGGDLQFAYNGYPFRPALLPEKHHAMPPESRTVLFLCTGNYYRSRFSEYLFNALAQKCGLNWQATSRGLKAWMAANEGPLSEFTAYRPSSLPRPISKPPISSLRSRGPSTTP
jgi:hypothetical protein